MKSCFFIGHREASSELLPILRQIVEKHISEYGVTEFIVGGYGRFDLLAAKAVISLKQQYPQITLSLLIPYHPASNARDLVEYAKKRERRNLISVTVLPRS